MEIYRSHVLVCGGTGCTSSGSARIIETFENEIKAAGLDKEVKVVRTGCFGLCEAGPVVIVYPEGTFYSRMKPEYVHEIVQERPVIDGGRGCFHGLIRFGACTAGFRAGQHQRKHGEKDNCFFHNAIILDNTLVSHVGRCGSSPRRGWSGRPWRCR